MGAEKQRHWFLTLWLVLMLLGNGGSAFSYATGANAIREALPGMPGWAVPVLMVLAIVNLACTVALFMWKRWGFWGFCAVSIAGLGINLASGAGLGMALFGLSGVVILFVALQVGGEKQGWAQLE